MSGPFTLAVTQRDVGKTFLVGSFPTSAGASAWGGANLTPNGWFVTLCGPSAITLDHAP